MKMSELQQKTITDIVAYVKEKQEELRKFRFGTAGSGMRNSHALRNLRHDIARALTELRHREKAEDSK